MIQLLAQSSSGGSPLTFLIFLAPLALLWWMMRNQKKRMQQQQAVQQQAGVGDEVLTTSGIFGTIVDEDEDEGTVILEIAPGTRIKMLRQGISRTIVDEPDDEPLDDRLEDPSDDDSAQGPIGS
jgi:preprotein translocase subunit YajC